MTGRTFGPAEHGAGALLCLGVFTVSAEIATAATSAAAWLLQPLAGSDGHRFWILEGSGSPWGLAVGVAFVGTVVAGFHALVRCGLVRAWLPPVAVPALASASIAALVAVVSEGDAHAAAVIGVSFGFVFGLAFVAWWYAGSWIARARRREGAVAMQE